MRVQVYRNLTRQCWSIRNKQTRRVIHHAPAVLLKDCRFVVSAAGRERVRRERRKYVHAWVEGELIGTGQFRVADGDVASGDADSYLNPYRPSALAPVGYNPYRDDAFMRRDTHTPVEAAEWVVLTETGCHALLRGGDNEATVQDDHRDLVGVRPE